MSKEAKVVREVKRVTGCTYLYRAQMVFVPGTGARIRYGIKSPFTRYSADLGRRIRPYLWTWHDCFIVKIWKSWAWVKVHQIIQQTEEPPYDESEDYY